MTKYYVLKVPVEHAGTKLMTDLNDFAKAGWRLHTVMAIEGDIIAVLHGEEEEPAKPGR